MSLNYNELRKQIEQKNLILDSITNGGNIDKDMVKAVKGELDRLLYQYYKMLGCRQNGI